MSIQNILLVLATGVAAGFINTLAGGGSLISMPVLIFLGLPSAVANGTNRIALMVQNIVAVSNFKRKGFFDLKFSLLLAAPAILGSIIGARLAINLPDKIFNTILAFVMLIILALILWQPQKRINYTHENLSLKRKIISVIAFFFVGLYGGFIQGGVGFIIIASLTLITGMSLVKINSIKVLVVAIYMVSSLAVFILNGKVNLLLGLILSIGNGVGAWLGSSFAVAKGDRWIKIILAVVMIIMSVKLLLGY